VVRKRRTTPRPAPRGPTAPAASDPGNPFSYEHFWVNPDSDAARTAAQWQQSGRAADAAQMRKIAGRPWAIWLNDGWTMSKLATTVAHIRTSGAVPVFVVYNLPWRDCGRYSSGGASSPAAYKSWISQVAARLAGGPAAVVIEPDALPEIPCLSADRQAAYYDMLAYDVAAFGANAGTATYLDAGHERWRSAATMADGLRRAGVDRARGFSLNISNFNATAGEIAYGHEISRLLGGKRFVIDTSRNGLGPASGSNWWCNPPGRALGTSPTSHTGDPLVDAFFWFKVPGESDGSCNGGPGSGNWWPDYALGLAQRSP